MGTKFKSYKSLILFFSFIFIIICPGCSDDDLENPGYHPIITEFNIDPTEIEEADGESVAVSATASYTDRDYYLDRGVCEVVFSVYDGAGNRVRYEDSFLQGGAQTESGSVTFSHIVPISTPTFYYFEMYVVDKTGLESNLVGEVFSVTEAE